MPSPLSLSPLTSLSFLTTTHNTLRILQLIFALTVLGLYGQTLTATHHPLSPKAVYAETVAGLSAVTALVLLVPGMAARSHVVFAWDGVLFILWTAVFGLFGKIYIHREISAGDGPGRRMKNAVWIDLVNMLLWFATAVLGAVVFLRARGGRSLHTGRAKV